MKHQNLSPAEKLGQKRPMKLDTSWEATNGDILKEAPLPLPIRMLELYGYPNRSGQYPETETLMMI